MILKTKISWPDLHINFEGRGFKIAWEWQELHWPVNMIKRS